MTCRYWLSYSLLVVLLLLGYFGMGLSRVYADTLVELPTNISPSGYVTFYYCPSNVLGWRMYKGTYPDISVLMFETNNPQICAISNGYFTMEQGYGNYTKVTNDGDYWVQMTWNGIPYIADFTGITYYWRATRLNGLWNYIQPNNTAGITSFTYSTSTNTARVQGYWYSTSTPEITQRLQFYQFSTLLGIESNQELLATTTGNFDLSFEFKGLPTPYTGTTSAPFISDTTLFAKIYQYDNKYFTDPFSGQFDNRYKTLLVSTTTTITQLTGINISTSTRALFAYPEYECGISSLTGCFKNALIWAFYPTEDTVIQYYSLIELIENKAPIGYFFVARDSIQGLNKDGTSNTSFIIPYSIKHYIFNPFDIGISGILWLFFLFSFYKRLKFIDI